MGVTRVTYVTPPAEVDAVNNLGDFECDIVSAMAQRPDILVVDFAEVRFMDSAAMRVLWQAREVMQAAGGRLMLRHVPPAVCRVLDAADFTPDE